MDLKFIMINSENPDKLAEFYTKIAGKPQWSDGGFTGWQTKTAGFMIGPHSEVKGQNDSPGRIMLAFECADVETEFNRIKEAGATVVSEPAHPGGEPTMTLACLADPDGNYFQLATPMPEDMPGDK